MKLEPLVSALSLTSAVGDIPSCFDGVYAGDFLSRAMSRVEAGDLWITIMSNVNVIAVASLTEAAAVVLAEGVALDPEAKAAAEEKGITVLSSPLSVYEICGILRAAEISEKG